MEPPTNRHEHRVERDGAVAVVTLDRPAAYNALTRELVAGLGATFEDLAADRTVRAIVLTGAGKAFCAGQALDDAATINANGAADVYRAIVDGYNPLIARLLTLPKPIVAALNGVAAGAGLGLALACDLRIAAEAAVFTTAFAKVGLVPDAGVSLLLPRLVGYARALEWCLLSDKIDASRARELGLVTEVTPVERVLDRARELAARLAAGPRALGLIKGALAHNALGDIGAALAHEAEVQRIAADSVDAREGIRAFGEKRAPVFTGC